ncbi:MAG: hypothetical protein AB7K24_26120 [Gemmataceae bacterium]
MLRRLQEILVRALTHDDPPGELKRALAEATDLPDADRALLESISDEGLRLSHIMIYKIRFEQLLRGHKEMARLFQEDPDEFMRLFRGYTAAVPSCSFLTDEEGQRFDEWRRSTT